MRMDCNTVVTSSCFWINVPISNWVTTVLCLAPYYANNILMITLWYCKILTNILRSFLKSLNENGLFPKLAVKGYWVLFFSPMFLSLKTLINFYELSVLICRPYRRLINKRACMAGINVYLIDIHTCNQ